MRPLSLFRRMCAQIGLIAYGVAGNRTLVCSMVGRRSAVLTRINKLAKVRSDDGIGSLILKVGGWCLILKVGGWCFRGLMGLPHQSGVRVGKVTVSAELLASLPLSLALLKST